MQLSLAHEPGLWQLTCSVAVGGAQTQEASSQALGRGGCAWAWMATIPAHTTHSAAAYCLHRAYHNLSSHPTHLSPHNVADTHEVVVHHVGQVVGGEPITLQQNLPETGEQ